MAQSSKASAGSSASSSTAAEALEQMAQIQKRIARGDTDAAQFLTERAIQKAEGAEGSDTRLEKLRALQSHKTPKEWWKSPGALAGAAVLGVLFLLYGLPAASRGGHSVSGKVLLNEHAASGMEIVFHSISQENVRVATRTEHDGAFVVQRLPAGDYKVFLNKADNVPQNYLSPLSTPLRLKLHEDMNDITFSVTTLKKRSPGKS
jgi:hypothetical protein